MMRFFKQLGEHQRKRLARRSKDVPGLKNTVDSFYVLYILSTGIIDDVKDLIRTLTEEGWYKLPLQIHIISIAPNHLKEQDQDS